MVARVPAPQFTRPDPHHALHSCTFYILLHLCHIHVMWAIIRPNPRLPLAAVHGGDAGSPSSPTEEGL